ncbi:MAG TPA: hypothetical protein VGI79_09425 [Caulobacteraceae bacterium]
MTAPPRQGLVRRAWEVATGFPGVHAANAALTILFSLVQMLIIARVVDHRTYSQTVAIQIASLFLLPINQAVARANFVLLRERMVRTAQADSLPEAAAAFQVSQIVLLIASLAIPPLVGAVDLRGYATMAMLLFSFTYNNIWYSEMQMTMMATGRAMRFEAVTFARRMLNYLSLAWLSKDLFPGGGAHDASQDFLVFSGLLAGQTVLFHVYLLWSVGRESALFGWPRGLTRAAGWAHAQRLWVSVQATFAEWLTLNGPYMVFIALFRVGAGLVAVDAVLKLLRMTVLVTRNLSEIALPRVSHAIFSGHPEKARLPALAALTAGGGAAAVIAAAVAFKEHLTFSILLGPNNTVPPGAGWPAAVAILSGAAFAVGSLLVGHSGHPRAIRRLMSVAVVAILAFAGYALATHPTVVQALWAFALSFAAVGLTALVLLANLLRRPIRSAAAASPQT